ncbi:hypothetical protein H4Q26_015126 [Puccinia striiformis f. sp. tritici PST-130]|nr:hypothetical protein H4Q26_015126 [Puccinia striiformis f. sp. tritici PST-130]
MSYAQGLQIAARYISPKVMNMTFHIIFFLMSLQNIRHTSNKYPSQFMSEAAYSSTGPDAQITDNLAYTIKDHGLLLHEKEISSSYLHDVRFHCPNFVSC